MDIMCITSFLSFSSGIYYWTFIYVQMHKGVSDPLEVVAAEISDEAIILCLDEFMVCVCLSKYWIDKYVSC